MNRKFIEWIECSRILCIEKIYKNVKNVTTKYVTTINNLKMHRDGIIDGTHWRHMQLL